MLDIGGRRLHLQESGQGSPVVVLESGIAATSLSWRTVQKEIARIHPRGQLRSRRAGLERRSHGAAHDGTTGGRSAGDAARRGSAASVHPGWPLLRRPDRARVCRPVSGRGGWNSPGRSAAARKNGIRCPSSREGPSHAASGCRGAARCSPASAWSAGACGRCWRDPDGCRKRWAAPLPDAGCR